MEKYRRSLKNIRSPLHPITILIVAAVLLILFVGFALLEYSQSKLDLRAMREEEAYIILDVLMASGERSILAYEELEGLVQSRLLNSGYWLEEIDYRQHVSNAFLDSLALKMDLYRIQLLDSSGHRVLSTALPHPEVEESPPTAEYLQVLAPLLSGEEEFVIIGLRVGRYLHEPRYAVAVKRRKGGAIVVTADARMLQAIRQELGPGRLIQEIGNRAGVVYVVLQDSLGILMASQSVTEMSRIAADPFLSELFVNSSRGTRTTDFEGDEIYEIVGSFPFEGDHIGLFRIGLEMDYYNNILRNARYRFTLIALLFVVVGIIGLSLMVAHQNAQLLSKSYQKVKTRTGEILFNLADAVVAVDGSGKIIIFNEAAQKLFGIQAGRATGKNIASLDCVFCPVLRESLETGKSIFEPQEEVAIAGTKRVLSLRTSIIRDEESVIDAAILVATDLTRQRHLEEKLRWQEKLTAMGELASGVAHEIRNPINAIGMIAQRFLKEFKPRQDEEEYLSLARSVVKETQRTNEIIRRFLEFSTPRPLQSSPIAAQVFLHEITGLFKSSTDAKGIKLQLHCKHDKRLSIDRDQMRQALLNILQNALDATPAGKTITITGRSAGADYDIAISDQGTGIERENLRKIFDLYFTTKKDGTGMGLPIVAQIVQSHGGSIDVESEPGRGTTFSIRLPLEDES